MEFTSYDFFIMLSVVIIFTIIQSIFGVGILVFGTPTLLLLDFSFFEALSYLLPCSATVSILQLRYGWFRIRLYKLAVIQYMLPGVVFGLVLVVYYLAINLNLIIGLMLILTFLARFSCNINAMFEKFLGGYFRSGFFLTGFIHGLTNLGGAPLVIITNSIYKDKKEIQANTAYAYLFMALSQLAILLLTSSFLFSFNVLLFPLISATIYILLGNYVFNMSSDNLYYNLMSSFILIYGILLFSKDL